MARTNARETARMEKSIKCSLGNGLFGRLTLDVLMCARPSKFSYARTLATSTHMERICCESRFVAGRFRRMPPSINWECWRASLCFLPIFARTKRARQLAILRAHSAPHKMPISMNKRRQISFNYRFMIVELWRCTLLTARAVFAFNLMNWHAIKSYLSVYRYFLNVRRNSFFFSLNLVLPWDSPQNITRDTQTSQAPFAVKTPQRYGIKNLNLLTIRNVIRVVAVTRSLFFFLVWSACNREHGNAIDETFTRLAHKHQCMLRHETTATKKLPKFPRNPFTWLRFGADHGQLTMNRTVSNKNSTAQLRGRIFSAVDCWLALFCWAGGAFLTPRSVYTHNLRGSSVRSKGTLTHSPPHKKAKTTAEIALDARIDVLAREACRWQTRPCPTEANRCQNRSAYTDIFRLVPWCVCMARVRTTVSVITTIRWRTAVLAY